MLTGLIPHNKNHSISEVVLTIFLEQPIIKPERYEDLISTHFGDEFHEFKKGISQSIGFKLGSDNKPELEIPDHHINGFTFRRFNKGKAEWVIISNNNLTPYISIHCLDYIRWKNFIEKAKKYLNVLGSFDNSLYIKAYGLNYVDQFQWIQNEPLPVDRIFEIENEYFPKVFNNSILPFDYTINHKIKRELDSGNDIEFMERLEIHIKEISSSITNISVIHNTIKELNDIKLLKDIIEAPLLFDNLINMAHMNNKEVMKKIFSKDILTLIDLK